MRHLITLKLEWTRLLKKMPRGVSSAFVSGISPWESPVEELWKTYQIPESWEEKNKGKFMYQIFSWIWYLLNIFWRYKCPIWYKWKVWWIICILESWFLSQEEDWDFLSLVCWKHDFMRSFLLIKSVEVHPFIYKTSNKQNKAWQYHQTAEIYIGKYIFNKGLEWGDAICDYISALMFSSISQSDGHNYKEHKLNHRIISL